MALGHSFWLATAVLLLTAACASPRLLAPAPNLYTMEAPYPEQRIPEAERRSDVELVFVTDRAFDAETGFYRSGRSAAVHAGIVRIELGKQLSWEALMHSSRMDADVPKQPKLGPVVISERLAFPDTPIPFGFQNGIFYENETDRRAYAESVNAFQNLVRERMDNLNTDSALVYIHGFNNSFEDAAHALTDLWHYSGRSTAPVLYSWPASEGSLLGYFSDRESGEFSIFHLKEFFRALQGIEELRSIHIIAQSRGTDVVTTALRELVIEARASKRSARNVLKVENLVLAAPDLDLEVVKQRLIAERFGPAIGQITIYTNPKDAALGLSSLVSAGLRFGRITSEDLGERVEQVFRGVRNVHFVNASHVTGMVGHSYFRTHPGILADIAVIIQTSARPDTRERPLVPVSGNFYRLEDDYQPRMAGSRD